MDSASSSCKLVCLWTLVRYWSAFLIPGPPMGGPLSEADSRVSPRAALVRTVCCTWLVLSQAVPQSMGEGRSCTVQLSADTRGATTLADYACLLAWKAGHVRYIHDTICYMLALLK